MRALPDALVQAQKQRTQTPCIGNLAISHDRWGAEVPDIVTVYDDASTASQFAACITNDGYLLRVKVNGAGDVLYQRSDPEQPAQPSGWTLLASAVASSLAPIAVCQSARYTNLLYVKPDGYGLVRRVSSNNGATWGSEVSVASDSAAPVGAVGIAARPGTDVRLVVWAAGNREAGSPSVQVSYTFINSGQIIAAPLPKFQAVEGLSVVSDGDWLCILTGSSWGVYTAIMGDGARYPSEQWAGFGTVTEADSDSGYRYLYPSLARMGQTYLCAFWLVRPGGPNKVAIARRLGGFDLDGWALPDPTDVASGPAQLLGTGGTSALLAGEVSLRSLDTRSASLNLTARLIAYRYREPGGLDLALSDTDNYSRSQEFAPVAPGASVEFSRGLIVSGSPLAIGVPGLQVESLARRSSDRTVIVRCRDVFGLLDSLCLNRSMVWSGTDSALAIFEALCSLVGLSVSVAGSSSPELLSAPGFTASPGESWLSAMRRLYRLIPERLRADGNGLVLVNPSVAEDFHSYGGSLGLPLVSVESETRSLDPNHVQIYGGDSGSVLGEALDPGSVLAEGDKLLKLFESGIATSDDAQSRASLSLQEARRAATRGTLRSTPNLALQVWDTIEVSASGYAQPERWLVNGFEERFDRRDGEWSQQLSLEGVA